jgi:hypothetical protein
MEVMMEVLMFSTHIPEQGQFGPWMPIDRRSDKSATKLSITAFRSDRSDKKELLPIRGEIEWQDESPVRSGRVEAFHGGMVDVVLQSHAPSPRIRFNGEGTAGGNLRIVVQFRDFAA